MKKMFLSLMMALVCLGANAQFEAGKKYVNASLAGLNLAYSKNTRFTANVQLTGGYFLAQDWMVLGRIGYNHPGKHMDNFEIGVGGRYYIEQNGLSLGLMASYEHGHAGDDKSNHGFLTPEVGYTFFVNRYVTLEPALYFKRCPDYFAGSASVRLKIGVGVYF